MFGTNNIATLYASAGWFGGRPAFEAKGTPFSCRCEPTQSVTSSGQSIEETADTLFISENIDAKTGDRIVFDGRNYLVRRVDILYAFGKIHHLEIQAKSEGA